MELLIVKNPRKNDTFENPDMVCDNCGNLSSYYAEFTDPEDESRSIMICKTCLDNSIREIDKSMQMDMARPVEECRSEAN